MDGKKRIEITLLRAAEILTISEKKARALLEDNQIAGYRIPPKGVRLFLDSVEAYHAEQKAIGVYDDVLQEEVAERRRQSNSRHQGREAVAQLGLFDGEPETGSQQR